MSFNLERLTNALDMLLDNGVEKLTTIYGEVISVIEAHGITTSAIKEAAEGQMVIGQSYLDTGEEVHYTAAQTGTEPFDLDSEEAANALIIEGDMAYAAAEVVEYLQGGERTDTVALYIARANLNINEERERFQTDTIEDEEPVAQRPARRGQGIDRSGW